MSLRAKKAEIIKKEKRNLFIISSLSVFEEKGFHNTRIKDITKKAGTSVGNFYNYFKSKEEVIEVIISGLTELMVNKFKELFIYFQENRFPPISAVKNLFRGYAKMFKEKKESFLIFFEQMGGMDQ
ncbi:MAG: TetR/AcrR family transcriptional regulator, partial [Promethearchaeota archaeon]